MVEPVAQLMFKARIRRLEFSTFALELLDILLLQKGQDVDKEGRTLHTDFCIIVRMVWNISLTPGLPLDSTRPAVLIMVLDGRNMSTMKNKDLRDLQMLLTRVRK